MNADRHHRRSIRLSGYDYADDGVYAVTICTYERVCLFGEVVGEAMVLNAFGQIAEDCWKAIPDHFPHVELDAFVIMPNHMHGIIVINRGYAPSAKSDAQNANHNKQVDPRDDKVEARHVSPLQKARGTAKGSLGAMIGSYKAAVSKRINELRDTPSAPLWQRNYYEQVIRNDVILNGLREYIDFNPTNWLLDAENLRASAGSPDRRHA